MAVHVCVQVISLWALSQSDRLIELLQKHFEYSDDYHRSLFSGNKNESILEIFNLNMSELIKEIQETSYPTLGG